MRKPGLKMSRGTAVGTLPWTRETQGVLRRRDRLAFLGQAALYGLATLPWEVRRALGIERRRLVRVDDAALEPPDSRASREAERLVAEGTSPMVASHSHRTYAWGAALAAHDGLRYDREVVYVASLLHDLYAEKPDALPHPHCFTLPAADRAEALAAAADWEEQRGTTAAEAITLHANLWPPRDSAEAYVVFVGARLDTVGYRYWDLHPETVGSVLERHPRLELKRESVPIFDAQAAANPGSRMHFMTRYLAATWFMCRAPFDE
jgi:hypothetical protein